jgi:hypothetical protein
MSLARSLLAATLLLLAACSTPGDARPELARAEVVSLAHQPAGEVAALVCSALHGAELAPDGRPRRGCSAARHDHEHADGSAHVSLTVDARTNSIVLAAPPGRDAELERALALVRQ